MRIRGRKGYSSLLLVETASVLLEQYEPYIEPWLRDEIESSAAMLRGLRVVHVNATPVGGGVAEILSSLVPLLRSVGVDAHWYVLPPDDAFFEVTKQIHNWLQGHPGHMGVGHRRTYAQYLEQVANAMGELHADVWVIHDPQPLPLRSMVPFEAPAVWRCHIDCSTPNGGVSEYLLPWIHEYQRSVFSLPDYVLQGLPTGHAAIAFPAIDPLTPKNRPLPLEEACSVLQELGIDPSRPLVTQVSRFDPWKNPLEAVDAYRLAKQELPELQLAMVGVFSAKDDPEGPRIYEQVKRHANEDPDVHLFTDPQRVAQREVNAFQSASTVVLQRSLREGFGLTVTEAMWKGRPVIGTPVGGIKVQIQNGQNGFLAETADVCAERIVQLVREPELARSIGEAARESVRRRFLLPRLLQEDLSLYHSLAASAATCSDVPLYAAQSAAVRLAQRSLAG